MVAFLTLILLCLNLPDASSNLNTVRSEQNYGVHPFVRGEITLVIQRHPLRRCRDTHRFPQIRVIHALIKIDATSLCSLLPKEQQRRR